MAIQLRVILIIMSVLVCFYISKKLKKSQLQLTDALFWIILSFVLIIISVFPQIAICLAKWLGIQSPVNFVFLVTLALLILRCFLLSIKVSSLEDKLRNLVEEVAIRNNDKEDK